MRYIGITLLWDLGQYFIDYIIIGAVALLRCPSEIYTWLAIYRILASVHELTYVFNPSYIRILRVIESNVNSLISGIRLYLTVVL